MQSELTGAQTPSIGLMAASRQVGKATKWLVGCSETVVCPTNRDLVYLVSSEGVSSLQPDASGLTIFGICELCPGKAIAGGSRGTLVEIDLKTRSVHVIKASSLGLPKPGRDIINMIPFMGSVAAIGKKGLIYVFSTFPESVEVPQSSRNDVFFFGGCELAGELWLSGLAGRKGVLARYVASSNSVEYYDTPAEANGRAFSISAVGDRLVLANAHVFVGKPDQWEIRNGFAKPECVAILPNPQESACTLISISGQAQPVTI